MIEKITHKDYEVQVARWMAEGVDPGIESTFPKVFSVIESGPAFHIFMEKMASITHPPEDGQAGRSIASTLGKLNTLDNTLLRDKTLRAKPVVRLATEVVGDSSALSDAELADMIRHMRSLPKVVAHNDAYWPNIFWTPDGQCRLIDFALMARNAPGADLHHFARGVLTEKDSPALFSSLLEEYSSQIGSKAAACEFSAYLTAFIRSIQRIRRGRIKRPDREKAVAILCSQRAKAAFERL